MRFAFGLVQWAIGASSLMVDVMSRAKRSALMARISGKHTAPELKVRRLLWSAGYRYRLHRKIPSGRPDVILASRRIAIFIHGCFWHGHKGCTYFRLPKTRPTFWASKLLANRLRDRRSIRLTSKAGWRVAVVWECALRNDVDQTGRLLVDWIESNSCSLEVLEKRGRVIHRSN